MCKLNVQFDSRISSAEAFLQKLRADTDKDFIRCPYLANIEIERRKHLQGKGDNDKLMESLVEFFCRYEVSHPTCRSLLELNESELWPCSHRFVRSQLNCF